MEYRWATAHEWLMDHVQKLEAAGKSAELAGVIRSLMFNLDGDDIQDTFQSEMDADGYFEDLDNQFVQVEYDIRYIGGDYVGVGEFVLLPLNEIKRHPSYAVDSDAAVKSVFVKQTGYNVRNIIQYSLDELYNAEHELIDQ